MKKRRRETLDNLTSIVKGFYNQLEDPTLTYNDLPDSKLKPPPSKKLSIQERKRLSVSSAQIKEDQESRKKLRVKRALSKLGDLFTVCQNCGTRILKDELISGVCFSCHNHEELNTVEKEIQNSRDNEQLIQLFGRIGELEAQVNSLQQVQQNLSSNNYNTNLNGIKKSLQPLPLSKNFPKGVPPPPPPPPKPGITDFIDITNLANITFSKLSMEELQSFTHEILSKLSLQQRNQYTSRFKELKLIEQMTSEEKTVYLRKKEQITQYNVDQKSVITSLNDSSSPLFKKMRERAEKSSLVGKGTLGVLHTKIIYVHCYKCSNSNRVNENDDTNCEYCNSPLYVR